VSWFERKTKLSGAKESTSDLEGLEKAVGTELPDALRSLLLKQSGDIWFDEFKSLTGDVSCIRYDRLQNPLTLL
jgi:hypothetical protein